MDNDLVAALTQVIGCRVDSTLERLDCLIFLFGAPGIGPGSYSKIRKNRRVTASREPTCLHKVQVILLHQAALFVFLMGHLLAHRVQVAVDVRTAGQNLDLELDGRDLQVRNEGVDDIPLFPGAAQHKVDGDNFDHLDKAMVFGIDNAVLHFLNGQIIRRLD